MVSPSQRRSTDTWVKSTPNCVMKWYGNKNLGADVSTKCEVVEVAAYGSTLLQDVENIWNKLVGKAKQLSEFKELSSHSATSQLPSRVGT